MVLSWDEIREMRDNGISFGAHTKTHPILTNENLEEAEKEIVDSKIIIEEQLKVNIKLFAYPNGAYNNKIIKLIKNNGFDCALSTNQSLINKYDVDDIYNLPRIEISKGFGKFKIKASGMFSDINSLLTRRE